MTDLVRAIMLLINAVPIKGEPINSSDSLSPAAPYRVVNIGNSQSVKLMDFIEAIEEKLGMKAIRNYMPMQIGDVPATWADSSLLQSLTGYRPQTDFYEVLPLLSIGIVGITMHEAKLKDFPFKKQKWV